MFISLWGTEKVLNAANAYWREKQIVGVNGNFNSHVSRPRSSLPNQRFLFVSFFFYDASQKAVFNFTFMTGAVLCENV